jgi:predicted RNase H-related nuclease YkuK (DUF458 family)
MRLTPILKTMLSDFFRLEELELHREYERRAEEERKSQEKAAEVAHPLDSSTVVVDMDIDTDEEGGQKVFVIILLSKSRFWRE